MPVDLSDVFLLRRIGCREAVACNLPFAADFFEDKQLLIGLVPFATTFDDRSASRVGACIGQLPRLGACVLLNAYERRRIQD